MVAILCMGACVHYSKLLSEANLSVLRALASKLVLMSNLTTYCFVDIFNRLSTLNRTEEYSDTCSACLTDPEPHSAACTELVIPRLLVQCSNVLLLFLQCLDSELDAEVHTLCQESSSSN